MESDFQLSFSDIPEDAQLRVLSFVNRKDLKAFACTSKKFSALCTNDERLWLLKCTRRWGSRTQIPKWGGGKMSYKNLFNLLKDYETLIRFWIYIYDDTPSTSPPLLLFEWCSFYITGYRISPSKDSGYGVIKTPFIWITATSDGEGLVYLDTSDGTLSLTEEDLLKEDSEKLRCTELIIAQVHTEKYDSIMKVWENQDFLDFRRRLNFANGLEEYENVYSSPPDGLMTQIREALAKTVSIPVPDEFSSKKLNSRQRRRRQRENQMMKALQWEASYFLQLHKRYDNYSRSPDQPLQGLWKGIARGQSLTLYIVTYTVYMGVLSCKMAGHSVTSQINDGLVFSASMEPFLEPPFSSKEKHIYDSRLHLRPAESNQPDPTVSDVVRIFYANKNLGPESSAPEDPQHAGGRIWLYADGSFGFGSLKDHYIIDLKPMVEDDKLLDVVI